MSIKLGRINIEQSESIQISFGNVEKTIIVGVDKQGNAFVSGPMNAEIQTIFVTENGLYKGSTTPSPLGEGRACPPEGDSARRRGEVKEN